MGLNPVESFRFQSTTDVAYRTAVARLRSMLVPRPTAPLADDTKAKSILLSPGLYESPRYMPKEGADEFDPNVQGHGPTEHSDLLAFIDRQAQYIDHLETEIDNNRAELGKVLEKVEEVVTENEALHDRLKEPTIRDVPATNDVQTKQLEVRCAELESDLFKARQSLRTSQEEIVDLRTQLSGQARSTFVKYTTCEIHLAEIDAVKRERNELLEKTAKLEQTVAELKGRESEAAEKVKSSLDLVDQMRGEKNSFATELKERQAEVERLQQRIRQLISETSQSRNESKLEADKFYTDEINRLKAELNQEVELCVQANTNLEFEKRRGMELRNQLEEQIRSHENFRLDMQMRFETLESQLAQTLQKKVKAESDIVNMRLEAERIEVEGKQEMLRLSTEVTLIRNQLIERNSDLKKCDAVIETMNEKMAEIQKARDLDNTIHKEKLVKSSEEVMKATAEAVQQKYAQERLQFEDVIKKQNSLMDKLRAECYTLAKKLEETSDIYKKNTLQLETEKTRLVQQYNSGLKKCADLEQKIQYYAAGQDQMLNRVHFMEEEEKIHSQKIVTLLTKQSLLQKERKRLESEVTLLRSQLNSRPEQLMSHVA